VTITELLDAFGATIRAEAGAIALYAGGSLAARSFRRPDPLIEEIRRRRDGQDVPISPGYRLRRASQVHQLVTGGIASVLTPRTHLPSPTIAPPPPSPLLHRFPHDRTATTLTTSAPLPPSAPPHHFCTASPLLHGPSLLHRSRVVTAVIMSNAVKRAAHSSENDRDKQNYRAIRRPFPGAGAP
jgi:hypothetical protein